MSDIIRKQQAEIVKAFISQQSNTYGHVGHFVEQREVGSKLEEDWEPLWQHGGFTYAVVELPCAWEGRVNIPYTLRCSETGKEASELIKMFKDCGADTKTYRIKRYMLPQDAADILEVNNTWKAREASRFADGTYTPLPWADEAWFKDDHASFNHYAHVSVEDKGKIAYTPNDHAGRINRKTRVSVGKYLNEFYGYALSRLGDKDAGVNVRGEKIHISMLQWYVKNFQHQYGGGTDLRFATTAEEMVHVYENGPNSCMSSKAKDYDSAPHHPVEVYAAGDLQLAYIMDEDGDISARALVWPEKMAVGRIYGDIMALRLALEEQGWNKENACSLYGARLKIIEHGDGHVMPYIDGDGKYGRHPDGKHFQIGGSYCATYTHGLDYDANSCTCERCEGSADSDDMYTVYTSRRQDTEQWCSYCFNNSTYICTVDEETYSDNVPYITTASGDMVARHNTEDYFKCHLTEQWYHIDDSVGLYEKTGKLICADAVEDLMLDEDGVYWRPDHFPTQGELDLAETAAA